MRQVIKNNKITIDEFYSQFLRESEIIKLNQAEEILSKIIDGLTVKWQDYGLWVSTYDENKDIVSKNDITVNNSKAIITGVNHAIDPSITFKQYEYKYPTDSISHYQKRDMYDFLMGVEKQQGFNVATIKNKSAKLASKTTSTNIDNLSYVYPNLKFNIVGQNILTIKIMVNGVERYSGPNMKFISFPIDYILLQQNEINDVKIRLYDGVKMISEDTITIKSESFVPVVNNHLLIDGVRYKIISYVLNGNEYDITLDKNMTNIITKNTTIENCKNIISVKGYVKYLTTENQKLYNFNHVQTIYNNGYAIDKFILVQDCTSIKTTISVKKQSTDDITLYPPVQIFGNTYDMPIFKSGTPFVISVNGQFGTVVLDAEDIKYDTNLNVKQKIDDIINKIGKPNGIASLDSNGKVLSTQLPSLDYIPLNQKGTANGVATLDGVGKVIAAQLPSLDYVPLSQKGVANGVATLNSSGKVPATQLEVDFTSVLNRITELENKVNALRLDNTQGLAIQVTNADPSTAKDGQIWIVKP